MTQEDKELLLKDICTRLPYGVVIEYNNDGCSATRELGLGSLHDFMFDNAELKPYLRPLSSMTEDERKDILQLLNIHGDIDNEGNLLLDVEYNILTLKVCKKYLEELNKRMFDVCHMIEKGLALEAAEKQ